MGMIVEGTCATAKIFANEVEERALQTIKEIANNPAFAGAPIRIMPDVHAGAGIVVGFTAPVGDAVNPAHVGVDVGCSVSVRMTNVKGINLVRLERDIRRAVGFGQDLQKKSVADVRDFCKYVQGRMNTWRSAWPEEIAGVFVDEEFVKATCIKVHESEGVFWKSLGTVGGGNHFIEAGALPNGCIGFTIHTGSRNFGLRVAKYHMAKGELLVGGDKSEYLTDMAFATAYSEYNHKVIADLIMDAVKKQAKSAKVVDSVMSMHNYIDFSDRVIRKGAIRADAEQRCVIPFNMRDGLAICTGRGNADWNCSAPHGAGRAMSRNAARRGLKVEDFVEQMRGIVSTSVGAGTIDEAPDAYKPMETIKELIADTVDIDFIIKPLLNMKALDTSVSDFE